MSKKGSANSQQKTHMRYLFQAEQYDVLVEEYKALKYACDIPDAIIVREMGEVLLFKFKISWVLRFFKIQIERNKKNKEKSR